jgi:benzoate membrane transport protein
VPEHLQTGLAGEAGFVAHASPCNGIPTMILSNLRQLSRDLSPSAIAAGFVTVLVGFASSAAIVFQAAQSLGASPAQIGSWIWALGLGMGFTCIALSLRYRKPVVTAWSTPGAAMLIASGSGLPLTDAIGAFLLSAVLIAAVGFSGIFEKMIGRIPVSLASGMLAGVLLRFGMGAFAAMQTQFGLVLAMFCTYLLSRRLLPRYAVILTLLAGLAFAAGFGLIAVDALSLQVAQPVFTAPTFSLAASVGIALPLFLVTMASQNVPGVAVIRASGYEIPISPVVGWIGVVNLLLAPFGAFALNLAAITAAICMGHEAHEDASRRYVAAIAAGIFYVVIGLLGATVAALFAALPGELIIAIAGIALLGTIGASLAAALREESGREPALVTFLMTASGLSLMGVGSAFWGLAAGVVTLLVLQAFRVDSSTT